MSSEPWYGRLTTHIGRAVFGFLVTMIGASGSFATTYTSSPAANVWTTGGNAIEMKVTSTSGLTAPLTGSIRFWVGKKDNTNFTGATASARTYEVVENGVVIGQMFPPTTVSVDYVDLMLSFTSGTRSYVFRKWSDNTIVTGGLTITATPDTTPPVVTTPSASAPIGGVINGTFSASDASNMPTVAVQLSRSGIFPAGSFATCLVSATPVPPTVAGGSGTYSFTASNVQCPGLTGVLNQVIWFRSYAQDAGGYAAYSASSFVNDPGNQPPALSSATATRNSDGSVSASVYASDIDKNSFGIQAYITDGSGMAVTASRKCLIANCTNLNLTDGTHSFSWTAAEMAAYAVGGGTFTVQFIATDSQGNSSTGFSNTFSVPAPFSVSSAAPLTGVVNTVVPVTVTGTGFTSTIRVSLSNQSGANCAAPSTWNTSSATFSCTLDTVGTQTLSVAQAVPGPSVRNFTFSVTPISAPAVSVVSPPSARTDIPQLFVVAGTGFVAGTTFALENCETDTSYTPTLTALEATFQCKPRLPGVASLLVNGTPVAGKTVFVDHPTRTGNPASRGVPSVKNVSLFNGNYHHEVTDMVVPGKGLPFTVSRSYNSYYSPYEAGRGAVDNYHPWRFNWDLSVQYVLNTGNRQLSVDREDGSGEGFYKDTTDNLWYAINQGGLSTLRADTPGPGFLTVTTRDGRNYVFNNPGVPVVGGRLYSISDHDGFALTLHYGINGKVDYVTDTVGRQHNFFYFPGTTLLQRVTDSTGRTVSYTWESDAVPARDRLKTVVDVRGYATTYNYWSNGSATEPRMFLTSIVDPLGNTVVQLTHAKGAYGNWGVTSLTDASLNLWGFQYCSDATLTKYCGTSPPATTVAFLTHVTAPLAAASFTSHFDLAGRYTGKTDALNQRLKVNPMPTAGLTLRTYAQAGLVDSRQTPEGVAAGYKTQFGYTAESNLLTQTNPDTGMRQNSWTPGAAPNCYNLTQTRSPQMVTRSMGYNTACKRTTTSLGGLPPSINSYNLVTKLLDQTSDPLGNATAYTYTPDGLGNVLTERDALLQVTTYGYDALGHVVSKTAPGGLVTLYAYDAAGNLTQETRDPTGLNLITRYQYDANGNQIQLINPRNHTTTTTYDAANRVLTVKRLSTSTPLAWSITTNHYDALGRLDSVQNANLHTSSTVYDGVGNVKSRSDALPRTTTYDIYDSDNRLKKQTDPEGRVTTYDYDTMGRVIKVTTPDGFVQTSYDTDGRVTSQTDKKGIITTYGYDPATGWRNRVTSAANFGADTTNTYMSYYNNGLLWKVTDPRGNVTTYAYDALGRRTSITDPKGRSWTTTYDPAGNVKTTLDPAGNLATHSYDLANRLVGTIWSVGGAVTASVTYVPDQNGNITSQTDSTGTTVKYYDEQNRVTGVINPQGQQVTYAYDPGGNIVTLTYPGTKPVTYRYDAAERMTGLSDWGTPPRATEFTLDRSDRVTAITRLGNGTSTAMAYDPAGRLSTLVHRKADTSIFESHALIRDANGNIQTDTNLLPLQPGLTTGTLSRTYDTDNRQVGITHDPAGRITNSGSYTLGWNAREQVTSINGATQTYTADGLRVADASAASRFVMDTNARLPNVLVETDLANTPKRYYIHSNYGLVEQIDAAGNPFFYHFDPSGNTRALTNASGQVTDAYAYTPFGVTTRSGSTPNPFQFVGQYGVRNFNNTQLYDMRARWYAADQARFMSLDPLMGKTGDAQTLNRYAYVGGNPVRLVDPSGLNAVDQNAVVASSFLKAVPRTGHDGTVISVKFSLDSVKDGLRVGAKKQIVDYLKGVGCNVIASETVIYIEGNSTDTGVAQDGCGLILQSTDPVDALLTALGDGFRLLMAVYKDGFKKAIMETQPERDRQIEEFGKSFKKTQWFQSQSDESKRMVGESPNGAPEASLLCSFIAGFFDLVTGGTSRDPCQ